MTTGLKWISLLAGIVALWMTYSVNGAPYIPNDGYQYLDAASNLAAGKCLCTNVVLFDEQVAYGRMPVPFTHFGPGYPLLIAGISRLGVAPETAGYLLSAAACLAVLWLIWDIALGLGAKPWVTALFSLVWITHASGLWYGATISAESLFGAFLMALVALIIRDVDVRREGRGIGFPLAIGLVAGLSYWIRYPGLFLVGGAGVYLLWRTWRSRESRPGGVAGIAAMSALVITIQVRNALYAGSWKGGFGNSGHHSPVAIVVESVQAFRYLLLGDRVPLRLDVFSGLFFLSAVALVFLIVRAAVQGRFRTTQSLAPFYWAVFIGAIYVLGVLAAALLTIASDFSRYYLPVYPLLLACLAALCSFAASGTGVWVVALAVLSTVAIESRGLTVAPHPADWVLTRGMLGEEVAPSVSLTQWLESHVPETGVIVAVEGQAVHFVVHRPVAAALEPRFSARPMDAETYLDMMRQYHSRYLVVFPGAPPERVPDQESSGFLHSLAEGALPPWLSLAVHSNDAAVYECRDCSN
jgi:hypothetical protein